MSKVSSKQIEKVTTQFINSGTDDRQLAIANDAVESTHLGFKMKHLRIPAVSMSLDGSGNTYFDLTDNAVMDSHLEYMVELSCNGVALEDRQSVTLSLAEQWLLTAEKVTIKGDVRSSGDIYLLSYPYSVAQGGGGVFETAKASSHVLTVNTTGVTQAEMTIGGGAPVANNVIVMDDFQGVMYKIHISAQQDGGDEAAGGYVIDAMLARGNGAGTTRLVGMFKLILAEDDLTWDATVEADTSLGGPKVLVTGGTGDSVTWTAHVLATKATP